MTKTTDEKIDLLARMVEKGFSEVRADIDDLARSTAQGFSDVRDDIATKADLESLENHVGVMLDKHIGTFRGDYDALAIRVKDLECAK